MDATIRPAAPEDAGALVELRAAMSAAMGQDVGPPDVSWRAAAERWFATHLVPGGDAVAVVADVPGRGPVGSALAVLVAKAPGPADPTALSAHVSQVSTLPGHRRRGYARASLQQLLALLDERGTRRSDLHATADGEALHRALGFEDRRYAHLRGRSPARPS